VRMPVALFSVEYLRQAFGGREPLNYVNVPLCAEDKLSAPETRPPSVEVANPIDAANVHLFDWDVRRRMEIAQATSGGTANELGRHQRWGRLFSDMFSGDPGELPRWFTPTTAKTIRMAFATGLL